MSPSSGERGRRFWFAALYFSEGAPIGFFWFALQPWLRQGGFALDRLGLLMAAVALPWALKVLWAPLLDLLRGPRWSYRSWMLAAQVAMGLFLLPVALLDPTRDFDLLVALCMAHAFAAATQDVAIDALAIATTAPEERGRLNGWMQGGKYLGRSLFGGVALLALDRFGLAAVLVALVAAIWGIAVALRRVPLVEPDRRPAGGPAAAVRAFGRDLWRAVRGRAMFWGLVFAALAGAGFEVAGGLMGSFLVDRGHPVETNAAFFAIAQPICLVAGALAGGWVADRAGKTRATLVFHALLVATVAALAAEALVGAPRSAATLVAGGALYVGIGLFIAASYAFFMDLTSPAVAATQFTAFMAMTNLCESWSVAAGGILARGFGHGRAYLWMLPVSLVALPALLLARRAGTAEDER